MEDNEENLLDLVRTFDVKSVKNKQHNSALWDVITDTFNKATNENYTKKQLQKRLAYVKYKDKNKESEIELDSEPLNLKDQIQRAQRAKKLADEICTSADNVMKERLKIEARVNEMNS